MLAIYFQQKQVIFICEENIAESKTFQEALDNARQAGFLGENILGIEGFNYDITIISGAGAYICGENSALLNSIEGKRGGRVSNHHT